MVKKFILAAMVGLGIAGLIFVSQKNVNLPQTKDGGNNLVSNKPFVEKLGGQSLLAKIENSLSGQNLTEEFTKNLADKIAGENPSGIQIQDGEKILSVPDPNQIALDLLIEAQKKFEYKNLFPDPKDSELKISRNNGKEASADYFKNLNKIMEESAAWLKTAELTDEVTPELLDKMIQMYDSAAKNLFTVSIPPELIPLHKKELTLLIAKKTVYQKIKNYEQDSLTAVLAANYLEQLDNEFAELNQKMGQFISDNQINF
ncbi:MAG: hypothetical protein HYY86_01565 [Candidatus Harrisonbacteria bacterium]|nr:hypothetical protein [Candidatus Harrisonbacteria bacterium]